MWTWDPVTARYRDRKTGRFLARATVREILDDVLERAGASVMALTQDLRAGRITLSAWQVHMADQVKSAAITQVALAKGGFDQLTQADYGRIGRWLGQGLGKSPGQYHLLRNFAQQVANGKQPLDGRAIVRSRMYMQAPRTLYHEAEREGMAVRGFDEERNVLESGASHCEGCLTEDGRGWVPVGELVRVGQRDCLANDKCRIDYRNSETGQVAAA